jgi:hypothetical protein
MTSKLRSVLAGTVQGSKCLIQRKTLKENAASLDMPFMQITKKPERI